MTVGDLILALAALPEPERTIAVRAALVIVARLAAGHEQYGPWQRRGRDLVAEARDEAADGLVYTIADLLDREAP